MVRILLDRRECVLLLSESNGLVAPGNPMAGFSGNRRGEFFVDRRRQTQPDLCGAGAGLLRPIRDPGIGL